MLKKCLCSDSCEISTEMTILCELCASVVYSHQRINR